MVAEPAAVPSALAVRGLRVALPDGRVLIDGIDLAIGAGEVVVLLGGSGAGKSTFARVLFERDELDDAGFEVVAAKLDLDRGQLGLVPQRGALFDHLDVRGNLRLALAHARSDAGPAGRSESASLQSGPGGRSESAPLQSGPAGRSESAPLQFGPADWLKRVGLDPALAEPGTPVTKL